MQRASTVKVNKFIGQTKQIYLNEKRTLFLSKIKEMCPNTNNFDIHFIFCDDLLTPAKQVHKHVFHSIDSICIYLLLMEL